MINGHDKDRNENAYVQAHQEYWVVLFCIRFTYIRFTIDDNNNFALHNRVWGQFLPRKPANRSR